jgi:uncharacterized protein (DUF4213/DUF364 family)
LPHDVLDHIQATSGEEKGNRKLKILDEILGALQDGKIEKVWVGAHWTAVVAQVGGERRCGLASTLVRHEHHGTPVPAAGRLEEIPARELAGLINSKSMTERSIGMATINAMLPRFPEAWEDQNAEEVIARLGEGKRVALIGSFPFARRLAGRVGELIVIDQTPQEGEYGPDQAGELLSSVEVVAITGMTFINHTFERLVEMCSKRARILVLGPSTPMHPLVYDYGVKFLSGSVVEKIDSVLHTVGQGATFRQVRRAGVRLVTMQKG